jgi:hypothetical protein
MPLPPMPPAAADNPADQGPPDGAVSLESIDNKLDQIMQALGIGAGGPKPPMPPMPMGGPPGPGGPKGLAPQKPGGPADFLSAIMGGR